MSGTTLAQTWQSFQRTAALICEFPSLTSLPHYASLCFKILNTPIPESGLKFQFFLEKNFDPFWLPHNESFHMTGYYEPVLEGSLEKDSFYPIPLFSPPKDLFFIPDLGPLNPALAHTRWAGRKDAESQIIPYFTRRDIQDGALKNTSPLLWLKDEIEAYFLHIQGSGKVKLPSGKTLTVRLVATNGHPYRSIRKTLVEQGKLPLHPPTTAQKLIDYLRSLSKTELREVLATNPSYIFFESSREKEDPQNPGPWGTFGEPYEKICLTPMHSVAVDPHFVPLGLPLFLTCGLFSEPLLCLAHDTGSAIKGPKRLDLFCGSGPAGFRKAERLNHAACGVILTPKAL